MDRLRTRSIFQSKILSTVLWECISGKILGGNRVYRCSQSNSGSHPSKCAVSIVPLTFRTLEAQAISSQQSAIRKPAISHWPLEIKAAISGWPLAENQPLAFSH
jgi:hypothetical protein